MPNIEFNNTILILLRQPKAKAWEIRWIINYFGLSRITKTILVRGLSVSAT